MQTMIVNRRQTLRVLRGLHRWLGFALLVVLCLGTARSLPVVIAAGSDSGLAAVAAVFEWEASGGGPANEPLTLALMAVVATLGVVLLGARLNHSGGRTHAPAGWDGGIRLVHRWIGAAFTVVLAVYLVVGVVGDPPAALGWTWLILLLTVNTIGLVLGLQRALARRPRRR